MNFIPVKKLNDYNITNLTNDITLNADEELYVKIIEKGAKYSDEEGNELFKTHIVIGHFIVRNKNSGEILDEFFENLCPFRLRTKEDKDLLFEALADKDETMRGEA